MGEGKRSIKFNGGCEMKFNEMSEEMKKIVLSGKNVVVGSGGGGGGKKGELLELLKGGCYNTRELSIEMKIGRRNVGTLKNYILNDGWLVNEMKEGKEVRFILFGIIRNGIKKEGCNRVEMKSDSWIDLWNYEEGVLVDCKVVEEVKKK